MGRNEVQRQPCSGPRTTAVLLMTGALALCSGCTALPLHRFKPFIAPPASKCAPDSKPVTAGDDSFHYELPKSIATAAPVTNFDAYHSNLQAAIQGKLPPSLERHKVTTDLVGLFAAVSAEAQLSGWIAGRNLTDRDKDFITGERRALQKHGRPKNITHGQMKDFAMKLMELQLQPGAATVTGKDVNQEALSAEQSKALAAHNEKAFVEYFKRYYKGTFVDRMGTSVSKPNVSPKLPVAFTVTDTDIAAAETVLLEFLIDQIDPTPVLVHTVAGQKPTFYPGGNTNAPTVYTLEVAHSKQIPEGGPDVCGITTTNAWVLKDLANGASDQAAVVGGLVANTPGGISFGLGVFGKVSIGDNQTLSVLVKSAASRLALRLTLHASYEILKNVYFNVQEP